MPPPGQWAGMQGFGSWLLRKSASATQTPIAACSAATHHQYHATHSASSNLQVRSLVHLELGDAPSALPTSLTRWLLVRVRVRVRVRVN